MGTMGLPAARSSTPSGMDLEVVNWENFFMPRHVHQHPQHVLHPDVANPLAPSSFLHELLPLQNLLLDGLQTNRGEEASTIGRPWTNQGPFENEAARAFEHAPMWAPHGPGQVPIHPPTAGGDMFSPQAWSQQLPHGMQYHGWPVDGQQHVPHQPQHEGEDVLGADLADVERLLMGAGITPT